MSSRTSVRWQRWAWRGAAIPAGAAASLVFPEAGWWWFAWIALVPTFLLVAHASDARDAAWRSWAAGVGYSLGVFHWVLGVLGPFAPFPIIASGLTWVPVGLALHFAIGRGRSARPVLGSVLSMLVVPSVWVLTEFVRSWHVFGGSWGLLGLSQWQVGTVRQLAAVGGVWALSWLLVVVNVGATISLRGDVARTARAAALVAPAVLVVATVAWGANRSLPEPDDHLRVAGVQPGRIVGPELRLTANEDLTDTLGTPAEDVDLIVWGQSSVGFDLLEDAEVRTRLEDLTTRAGTPLLVNVDDRRADGRIAKSSVLIDPDAGLVATYDKQRLVPFGEYVPFRSLFGWVDRFTEAAEEDRLPGGELTVFDVDGTAVGPLISYESTFSDLRRSLARLGPDVVVVQGASTTFQGSWAQPQQAAYEAIRAVESGRSSMLVAVSGTSAAFDPSGRLLAWFPSDRTGVIRADLPVSAVDTVYVRWGDWVPVASLLVVMAWLIALVGARRLPTGARSGDGTGSPHR